MTTLHKILVCGQVWFVHPLVDTALFREAVARMETMEPGSEIGWTDEQQEAFLAVVNDYRTYKPGR